MPLMVNYTDKTMQQNYTYTQTFYNSMYFVWDNPDELVSE